MKNFSVIVATDLFNGIGVKGGLPWHFKEDMKYFKEVTTDKVYQSVENIVIMGRKTWESLPKNVKPLPYRQNIVVSSNKDYLLPSAVTLACSLQDAFKKAEEKKGKIFVIGGANIYAQAIQSKNCEEIFITKIHKDFCCDVFFPDISPVFEVKDCKSCVADGVVLEFFRYLRAE